MSPTPEIPGYELHDGWLIKGRDRSRVAFFDTPLPRPYTALDQLKLELRSPGAWLLFLGIVCSMALAAFLASAVLIFPVFVMSPILGNLFTTAMWVRRHGVVGIVPIGAVQYDHATFGMNEITLEGSPRQVQYALPPVRAILEAGYDVELRVVYLPKGRVETLAYRAVPRAA